MASDGGARPILVVEDDPQSRDGLLYLLESYGYVVITAADGAEALARLRQGIDPCVILLDLNLPGGGGSGFRDVQCQDPCLARIPVILLSGRVDIESEAERLGVAGCCAKPVDCEALLAMIDRHRLRS